MEAPIYYLQWHITHACNLRCVHCYQEDYRSHMPRAQLFAALEDFAALISDKNVRPQVNLTGGEPLLHPDFFPLAEEIRRREWRLGVLTNGTLIDEETADRLAALRPVFVQISLDGPPAVHDQIRGAGNFDRAMQGIDRLKARGVRVLVSFTAQKGNASSFAALAKLCRKHNVDKLWWDRVVTEGEEQKEALALTTEQFRRLVRTGNRLRERWRRPDGTSMVSNGRALQCADFNRDAPYRCSAGQNLLILLADGSLMPCRRLPFVIGNLRDGSMRQLTEQSELLRELARPLVPQGCAGCPRLLHCRGGARCVTYGQTGRLDLRDVNCFYFPKSNIFHRLGGSK